MRHIVIDIETLGIEPGCVILEIGAASFVHGQTEDVTDTFSIAIDKKKSMVELGAFTESKTKDWWVTRYPITYGKILNDCRKGNLSPEDALEKFSAWIFDSAKDQDIWFWGNGPEFDMSILNWYYSRVSTVNSPFNFRRVASMRSLSALLPNTRLNENISNEYPHRALHDALYEARELQKFINEHIK